MRQKLKSRLKIRWTSLIFGFHSGVGARAADFLAGQHEVGRARQKVSDSARQRGETERRDAEEAL